jgi:hypothetical protein
MERDRRGVRVGLRTRLPCGKEAEESATSLCYCTRASKPLGLLTYYCSVIIMFQRFFSFPHHFRSPQKCKNQKQFPVDLEPIIFFFIFAVKVVTWEIHFEACGRNEVDKFETVCGALRNMFEYFKAMRTCVCVCARAHH